MQVGALVRPVALSREGSTIEIDSIFELADASSADEASAEKAPASASVPAPDGSVAMAIEVRRGGDRIEVQVEGASDSWSVLLRGVDAVQAVEGGTAQDDPLGARLVLAGGLERVAVRL